MCSIKDYSSINRKIFGGGPPLYRRVAKVKFSVAWGFGSELGFRVLRLICMTFLTISQTQLD